MATITAWYTDCLAEDISCYSFEVRTMKRITARTFHVVALFGLMAAGSSFAQDVNASRSPHRVALLVGVNNYEKRGFADLKWPENDVDELAAELRQMGFEKVVVMKGSLAEDNPLKATSENIPRRLNELLRGIGKQDIVWVSLSGHGQQITIVRDDKTTVETDFFCPVDAVDGDPTTMLAIDKLTDDILRSRGGRNLVLIDACRDNPEEGRNRSIRSRGIQGRVVS